MRSEKICCFSVVSFSFGYPVFDAFLIQQFSDPINIF